MSKEKPDTQNQKREDSTTKFTEIKSIIKQYYEQLYANKLVNLYVMDKFLEMYNLPGLNHEETENMNRPN